MKTADNATTLAHEIVTEVVANSLEAQARRLADATGLPLKDVLSNLKGREARKRYAAKRYATMKIINAAIRAAEQRG